MWQLPCHRSGTTTLRVVNGIGSASCAFLSVGAGLGAPFVAVDELNISVFVDGDLEIGDGSLLLRNAATARNGGTIALRHLSLEAVTLHEYQYSNKPRSSRSFLPIDPRCG